MEDDSGEVGRGGLRGINVAQKWRYKQPDGWRDGWMDVWRAYREDRLTFTWGRTFILAPDAPLPKGSLGKQGCHLLTGRRITEPPKHTAHDILFKVFSFLTPQPSWLANKGHYCETADVNIHIDMYIYIYGG